jgi:hypothetical protein
MQLEERVAAAIRAQTDVLEPFTPELDSIRGSARRQTRRRAVLSAAAAVAVVVVLLTAGLVDLGRPDRSIPPADRPEHTDGTGAVTIPAIRPEQMVVRIPTPVPVRMAGGGGQFPARGRWFRSGWYSVTTVAAAATGARELSVSVPPSTHERMAQATLLYTDRFSRCLDRFRSSPQTQDRWEICMPTVRLLVDGKPVADQSEGPFSGRAGWGPLAPGSSHRITFRVTQGDPRNVDDLMVLVYEKDR